MKFYKFFFIFSITFFINQNLKAQEIVNDSLAEKSYGYFIDSFYKNLKDTTIAKVYAHAYLKKAEKNKAFTYKLYGNFLLSQYKNDYKEFHVFCDSLIKIYESQKKYDFLIEIRSQKANAYEVKKLKNKALKEYLAIKKIINYYKNDSIYEFVNYRIGTIKLANKQYKGAKDIFNDILKKKKTNSNNPILTYKIYNKLTLIYSLLKKYDSAYYFLDKGYGIPYQYKSLEHTRTLLYYNAKLKFEEKKYDIAIKHLKRYIKFIIPDHVAINRLSYCYTLLAICYDKTNNYKEAKRFHYKVDSIYKKENIINPEIEKTYYFLIEKSKDENNLTEQLNYLNSLIDINNYNNKINQELNISLSENYDKPKLISEKNEIIAKLQKKANRNQLYKLLYGTGILIVLLILIYQTKRKRNYKRQFLKLIEEEQNSNTVSFNNTTLTPKQDSYKISKEVSKTLLKKLDLFEKNKGFLNPEINLKKLANSLNTNSSYLSKVINQHKQQNFANYINQLRVKYIVNELKHNTTFQKYTVKALAEEVGFKSAESFSKAFYKFTNVKPSYFINELKKINSN